MKNLILKLLPVFDLLLVPLVYPAAWLLKNIRNAGVQRLPFCRDALMRIGVFPIRNHYYEPQFDNRNPSQPFSRDRNLPAIDWNINEQIEILSKLVFSHELIDIPEANPGNVNFYLENDTFKSGDAEYWYQMIRAVKPRKIIEVGSGQSTLMAIKAITKNNKENPSYTCKHICIEPYEIPWLEEANVSLVRRKVEELDIAFFSELEENDILFIDSSHIIRPQGDVLFLYLQLLPSLNKGVIVHLHDIFSPKNYLEEWLKDKVKFYNEQYLLEAFLSYNNNWKIIGALNLLHHKYYDKLKAVAPFLTPDREPGSFYIQKTKEHKKL